MERLTWNYRNKFKLRKPIWCGQKIVSYFFFNFCFAFSVFFSDKHFTLQNLFLGWTSSSLLLSYFFSSLFFHIQQFTSPYESLREGERERFVDDRLVARYWTVANCTLGHLCEWIHSIIIGVCWREKQQPFNGRERERERVSESDRQIVAEHPLYGEHFSRLVHSEICSFLPLFLLSF